MSHENRKRAEKQKTPFISEWGFWILMRRRPTLPHTFACSTIGPAGLNFRVRDGIHVIGPTSTKIFGSRALTSRGTYRHNSAMLKVCRAAHTYGSITSGFDDLCFTISIRSYFSLVVAVSVLILLLTSCGGSGGASQPPPPSLSLTASPNAVSISPS